MYDAILEENVINFNDSIIVVHANLDNGRIHYNNIHLRIYYTIYCMDIFIPIVFPVRYVSSLDNFDVLFRCTYRCIKRVLLLHLIILSSTEFNTYISVLFIRMDGMKCDKTET